MYTIWLKLEDDAVGRRYHSPNVRSASFRRAHIMTCSRPQNMMYHRQVCLQRLKDSHQPSQCTQIQTKHTCTIKKRRCINRHRHATPLQTHNKHSPGTTLGSTMRSTRSFPATIPSHSTRGGALESSSCESSRLLENVVVVAQCSVGASDVADAAATASQCVEAV